MGRLARKYLVHKIFGLQHRQRCVLHIWRRLGLATSSEERLEKKGDRFCKSFIISLRKFDVYLQYNVTWVGNPRVPQSHLTPFPPKWKRVRNSNNRSRSDLLHQDSGAIGICLILKSCPAETSWDVNQMPLLKHTAQKEADGF